MQHTYQWKFAVFELAFTSKNDSVNGIEYKEKLQIGSLFVAYV